MRYFIQSAGYARYHGFRYYEINTDTGQLTHTSQTKIEQEDNPAFKGLVDADEFYLALLNYQTKYRLFIGGLYSDDRYDFDSRTLGNYLVFYAENEDENDQLQQLSAGILENQESFRKAIDDIVRPNTIKDGIGFSLNWREYKKLLSNYWQSNEKKRDALTGRKIANISSEHKQDLAQELRYCNLPKSDGVLIVVTNIVNVTRFQTQPNICRVLTALIESAEWQELLFEKKRDPVNTESTTLCSLSDSCSSPPAPVSDKTIPFFGKNIAVAESLKTGRIISFGISCDGGSAFIKKKEVFHFSDLKWHHMP